MRLPRSYSALLLAALLASASQSAVAGSLEVKAPELDASEKSTGVAYEIKTGLPVGADPSQRPFEINKGYTFADGLKAGIKAGFDSPMGDDMRLTEASLETRLALGRLGPSISWGWFSGLDMRVQSTEINTVATGPLVKFGSDKLALTLNPKVEQTLGAKHEGGVAFGYAAGLKSDVARGVSFGIEAFGSQAPTEIDAAAQAQRMSQSLYVGIGLTPMQKDGAQPSQFSLELGALANMTEASPDLTGRIKAAVRW
jgi:hypothetical protein